MAKNQQQVVILSGPHKTASTAVQQMLKALQKRNQLKGWNWPNTIGENEKEFSRTVQELFRDDDSSSSSSEELQVLREKMRVAWDAGDGIVFGTEYLDAIGSLEDDNAKKKVIQKLWSLLPAPTHVNVVVVYRTPRFSHLVSIYSQQITMSRQKKPRTHHPYRTALLNRTKRKTNPPTLVDFLCHGEWSGVMKYHVDNLIASQLNPMGILDAFSRFGNANVTVIDMTDGDVTRVVKCDLLGLPCQQHRQAVNRATIYDPIDYGMEEEEWTEAENLLRRMDCYYYCRLQEQQLTVLHGKDIMFSSDNGWKNCCKFPEHNLNPTEAFQHLQSLGCRAHARADEMKSLINHKQAEETNVLMNSSEARLYEMKSLINHKQAEETSVLMDRSEQLYKMSTNWFYATMIILLLFARLCKQWRNKLPGQKFL